MIEVQDLRRVRRLVQTSGPQAGVGLPETARQGSRPLRTVEVFRLISQAQEDGLKAS